MSEASEQIWKAIQAANRAWLDGRPEEVASLFHEDVVMIAPNMERVVRGRDAMVQSSIDYCAQVKTHAFTELDHVVDVFADTAIATFRFDVTYEINGARHQEIGQEILAFERQGQAWRAVWRTRVPAATQS